MLNQERLPESPRAQRMLKRYKEPSPKERRVDRYCQDWSREVTQALARYDNLPVERVIVPSSFALLNWKSWSLRYAVSVDFIVQTLLAYYSKIRRDVGSLGIGIKQLTGVRAHEIVMQNVTVTFHDGENYTVYSNDLRERMLLRPLPKFDSHASIEDSIQHYDRWIQEQRLHKQLLSKRLNRPFRGNPLKEHG